MWTNENRARYDRSQLRYPSELSDAEFALVEPIIPPAKRGGNRRHGNIREVINGPMDILNTGCRRRAIPKDLPPRATLHGYFDLWSWDGTRDRIHHTLYVKCREQALREPSPAAIIDSQGGKSAEPFGRLRRGRRLIRMDMMRARRSRARSATFSSTRKDCR